MHEKDSKMCLQWEARGVSHTFLMLKIVVTRVVDLLMYGNFENKRNRKAAIHTFLFARCTGSGVGRLINLAKTAQARVRNAKPTNISCQKQVPSESRLKKPISKGRGTKQASKKYRKLNTLVDGKYKQTGSLF